jgi:hypothetical protein
MIFSRIANLDFLIKKNIIIIFNGGAEFLILKTNVKEFFSKLIDLNFRPNN